MTKDKSEQQNIPHHIHDKTFNLYGQHAYCFIPLVKLALGKKRAAAFDWDSAKLVDTRQVQLDSMTEQRLDAALSVTIELGASRITVIILIEHKSRPDPGLMKQLLRYQNEHYQSSDEPMVAIVCYHGRTHVADLPSFQDSLNYGDTKSKASFKRLFGDLLLDYRVIFVNMPALAESDAPLDAGLECMFHTMTYIFDITWQQIRQMYAKAGRVIDPERRRNAKMVSFTYINKYHRGKYEMDELKEMEREMEPDPDRRVLTDFESWDDFDEKFSVDVMDRCRNEGREEGIEENTRKTVSRMIENGFDLDQICTATDLSRDEVEEIRSRHSD